MNRVVDTITRFVATVCTRDTRHRARIAIRESAVANLQSDICNLQGQRAARSPSLGRVVVDLARVAGRWRV